MIFTVVLLVPGGPHSTSRLLTRLMWIFLLPHKMSRYWAQLVKPSLGLDLEWFIIWDSSRKLFTLTLFWRQLLCLLLWFQDYLSWREVRWLQLAWTICPTGSTEHSFIRQTFTPSFINFSWPCSAHKWSRVEKSLNCPRAFGYLDGAAISCRVTKLGKLPKLRF